MILFFGSVYTNVNVHCIQSNHSLPPLPQSTSPHNVRDSAKQQKPQQLSALATRQQLSGGLAWAGEIPLGRRRLSDWRKGRT